MLAPAPGELAPPPRGNPGSATAVTCLVEVTLLEKELLPTTLQKEITHISKNNT